MASEEWTTTYVHRTYPLGLEISKEALGIFDNLSDAVYRCGAPPSVPRKVTWFDWVKGWWGDWRYWWHTRPGGKWEDDADDYDDDC